jgi:hypothetical protein
MTLIGLAGKWNQWVVVQLCSNYFTDYCLSMMDQTCMCGKVSPARASINTFMYLLVLVLPIEIPIQPMAVTRGRDSCLYPFYMYNECSSARQDAFTISLFLLLLPHTCNSTFTLFPIASCNSGPANAGVTQSLTNASTCSGARPTKLAGSRSSSSDALIGSKYASPRTRSIRSFSSPRCLTWCAASWEST